MTRFAFFTLVAILPVAGCDCGDSHEPSDPDAGIVIMDGGPGTDSGPRPDGGPRPDAPPVGMDSGPRIDSGPTPTECGNGVLERGETCDDNNTTDGDGCDSMCRREAFCGDGNPDPGEVCDDGNNASGDGCRSDCLSDETCGNGIRDVVAGEICDDMMAPGGCSDDCMTLAGCGNMMVDPGESCDDGNAVTFDGCGPDCQTEISVVLDSLEIGRSEGCDYSGDGMADNAFGDALGGAASFLNMQIADAIDMGDLILLGHFLGLDDITGAADSSLRTAIVNGIDEDMPPDPSDNLGGMGRFFADSMAIGPDGLPIASMESRIVGRQLDGGPEDITLALAFGGMALPLQLRQAFISATTRASGGRLSNLDDGLLCGVIPVSALAMVPNPAAGFGGASEGCDGDPDYSLADMLVGGATIVIISIGPASPDVDLDGDGLESFVIDDTGPPGDCQPVIVGCIDGDGTVIDGSDCVNDARIQDGFSAGLPFTAVGARIVGTM